MTPQEQELVNELFHRLAQLESNPRDPSAERLIADGLRDAPHAVYALVQTALVQDEALKRANARIEELQAQTADELQQHGGFWTTCATSYSASATCEAQYHRCAYKHNLHPQRLRPILRVPVWHRGWARPLVRADHFSVRPHRRQRE